MNYLKIFSVIVILFALIAGGFNSDLVDYWDPGAGHDAEPLSEDLEFGPSKNVTAFYPAQASLQWLTNVDGHDHPVAGDGSMENHPNFAADNVITSGTSCQSCHGDDLKDREFASTLVDEEKGVEGKEMYRDIELQAAFDDDYLYLKAVWETQGERPGITHGTFQYLNGDWERNTTDKTTANADPQQLADGEFFSYEDRFAVMLMPTDLGKELKAFGNEGASFVDAGCFIACHSNLREMPERPDAADIQDDPWLGKDNLDRTDMRHYLLHTRDVEEFEDATADGNWPTEGTGYDKNRQIENFQNGEFIDLIQFRGARSAAKYGSSNDAILEYRHSGLADNNQGANYWFNQSPGDAQPGNVEELEYDENNHQWVDGSGNPVSVTDYNWMYDDEIKNFNAIPGSAIDDDKKVINLEWTARYPLITMGPDRNAVPLDMNEISEEDLLPRRVLRKAGGIRSALTTYSKWDENTNEWTVVIRRPLNNEPCDHGGYGDWCSDHNIAVGDLLGTGTGITAAFAIFDDHSSNRYHHVTFSKLIQDSEDADIRAHNNSTFNTLRPEQEPSLVDLGQNYPNPFEIKTTVPVALESGKDISIRVFNQYGQEVHTLFDGFMPSGKHELTWERGELEPGFYFYTIEGNGFRESNRAIIK